MKLKRIMITIRRDGSENQTYYLSFFAQNIVLNNSPG